MNLDYKKVAEQIHWLGVHKPGNPVSQNVDQALRSNGFEGALTISVLEQIDKHMNLIVLGLEVKQAIHESDNKAANENV